MKEGEGEGERRTRLWRYRWKFRADAPLLKQYLYTQGIQWDCIGARVLPSLDHIIVLESEVSA